MAQHGKHAAGKHAPKASTASQTDAQELERKGEELDADAKVSPEVDAASTEPSTSGGMPSSDRGAYTASSQENETPSGTHGVEAHSKPMRKRHKGLIAAIIVIIILLAALCFAGWRLLVAANDAARDSADAPEARPTIEVDDETSSSTFEVQAVDLTALIGLSQDDAVSALGDGATVVATTSSTTEGDNPQTTTYVTVNLPVTSTTRGQTTPSVYLTVGPDGLVSSAGYSNTLRQLGFNDASFVDAVNEQHAIELVVRACGIVVPDGVAVLPDDVGEYRTYADDGTTVRQDQYTFTGTDSSSDGIRYDWTCRLTFDYTAANLSNDLSDTVNQIYVTVTPHVDEEATTTEDTSTTDGQTTDDTQAATA
jgi:hypothetical protein